MNKIALGLQLYTLRDETAKDFVGTLQKVAELGYKELEFAGYGGLSAAELKNVLDGLGLQAVSSHVGYQELAERLDETLEYVLEIGAKYVTCPWLPADMLKEPDAFRSLTELFRKAGEACRRNGLTFTYHNHAFEFEKVDGVYLLDRLFAAVDADFMQAELDLYWVKKGGEDPQAYLQKYAGRVPLVHLKDMAADAEGSFAEIGQGVLHYPELIAAAKEAGVCHFFVEQDVCRRPPLESVKMSIDYLREAGIAL